MDSIGRVGYLPRVATWVATIPDVDARLRGQPPARVADIVCGAGWAAARTGRLTVRRRRQDRRAVHRTRGPAGTDDLHGEHPALPARGPGLPRRRRNRG